LFFDSKTNCISAGAGESDGWVGNVSDVARSDGPANGIAGNISGTGVGKRVRVTDIGVCEACLQVAGSRRRHSYCDCVANAVYASDIGTGLHYKNFKANDIRSCLGIGVILIA